VSGPPAGRPAKPVSSISSSRTCARSSLRFIRIARAADSRHLRNPRPRRSCSGPAGRIFDRCGAHPCHEVGPFELIEVDLHRLEWFLSSWPPRRLSHPAASGRARGRQGPDAEALVSNPAGSRRTGAHHRTLLPTSSGAGQAAELIDPDSGSLLELTRANRLDPGSSARPSCAHGEKTPARQSG